jgi:outer membrane receptor protein involved in Fe transport
MPLVALAALLLQLVAPPALTGTVLDSSGAAIAGAAVTVENTALTIITAADGTFALPAVALPATLVVTAPGFTEQRLLVPAAPAGPLRIVLEPRGITTSLTVSASADRARVSTPAAVTVLDRATLEGTPAFTLDEQLRSVPGFGLFRRSSSRVANPTTQGVTLRGLAASGASRATVVADGLPLADPFGGWVYWDRVPAAAIERVEVARGGASDIFGSDATGGAIRIETSSAGATLVAEGGEDRTARVSGFAGRSLKGVAVRGGVEQFTTDGFVVVAPESRGPIDIPADSRHTSVFAALGVPVAAARIELRGGYFSERRGNGTPFQSNATEGGDLLGRGSGAAFGGFWSLQGVLTSQDYDQTFSAINAARDSERPTSTQHVDSSSLALALDFVKPAGRPPSPAPRPCTRCSGRRRSLARRPGPCLPAPRWPRERARTRGTLGAPAPTRPTWAPSCRGCPTRSGPRPR